MQITILPSIICTCHSVGTTMASAGVSLEAIRDTFNHSSYEISHKYIAPVKEDVINALKTLKDFN